jgi:hypothetical protein
MSLFLVLEVFACQGNAKKERFGARQGLAGSISTLGLTRR